MKEVAMFEACSRHGVGTESLSAVVKRVRGRQPYWGTKRRLRRGWVYGTKQVYGTDTACPFLERVNGSVQWTLG